jgi:serine protease
LPARTIDEVLEQLDEIVDLARRKKGRLGSGAETSWSNSGRCVDIWAPGKSILSTENGGGTTTMTGTSMAAPHVGGTGALYLSSKPQAAPATVESALKSASVSTGKIGDGGHRIRLVYAGEY